MPSVNFTVRWPNGETSQFYSPSTVIYDYLSPDQRYNVADFMKQVENGLGQASERVRARYGFACSAALDNLASIKQHTRFWGLPFKKALKLLK